MSKNRGDNMDDSHDTFAGSWTRLRSSMSDIEVLIRFSLRQVWLLQF